MARTWIRTGSPQNHAATAARDFSVIGPKERAHLARVAAVAAATR